MNKAKVTAVVLNYNSSSDCKKCIEFLEKQDYENLDVIVVDNASSNEDEKRILNQICKTNIRLILNPTNGGFSAGNNVGLRIAVQEGAEWMLVINPDVELRDSHYISYVMQQLPKWSNVAVVGTNVVLPDGTTQNPMREIHWFEEILWPLEKLKKCIGVKNTYRTKNRTGYCEKVSGCCFFISKEFLKKNNYLDESVFMYCEEPILAKSVAKLGYKVLYLKDVTASHEHYEQRKNGNSKTRMLYFLKSRLYYIDNYSGYIPIIKQLCVLSRKLEMFVWRIRQDYDIYQKERE